MSSTDLDVGSREYIKRRGLTHRSRDKQLHDVDIAVRKIIDTVRARGEKGAREFARKFDKWNGDVLMSKTAIRAAVDRVPKTTRRDIEFSLKQIESFARAQREQCRDTITTTPAGVECGSKVVPVSVAGCYVPGGRYAHIASALMTVATAKTAGVKTIVACSPPRDEHGIHPAVVYAMVRAGADHILCIGGAQALACMAFGLFTGHKASVIVGPGNRFVVSAKRQLFGEVGIDMIAGPTESCVLVSDPSDEHCVLSSLIPCSKSRDDKMTLPTCFVPGGRYSRFTPYCHRFSIAV